MNKARVIDAKEVGTIKYTCGFMSRFESEYHVATPGMKIWELEYEYFGEEQELYGGSDRDTYIGPRGGPVFNFDMQDFEINYEHGCIELYDGTTLKEMFKDINPQTFQAEVLGRRNPDALTIDDFVNLRDWSVQGIYQQICFGMNSGEWALAAHCIIGVIENDMSLRLTEGEVSSRRHAEYLQDRIEELQSMSKKLGVRNPLRVQPGEGDDDNSITS